MKRFKNPIKKKLEEAILSIPVEIDTDTASDADLLRIAISSEQSAITLYNQLANIAEDDQLRRVLIDIAREEKIHIGEFQSLIYTIDPEEYNAHLEGEQEVEEI